uniref:DNA/RNA-binding protein Alba-like domain-containing protein n=1 Tax=Arcella intermedia TaxID=1963864 RepID=A0A6B2LRI5_9EUKA
MSLFFYVDLATRFLEKGEHTVTLSALGFAITTAVTIAEILKGQDVVKIERIKTSLTTATDQNTQKPKIDIILRKSDNFNTVIEKKKTLAAENKAIREALNAVREKVQERIGKKST